MILFLSFERSVVDTCHPRGPRARSVAIVPLKKSKASGESHTHETSDTPAMCKSMHSTYFPSGDYRLTGIPLRFHLRHSQNLCECSQKTNRRPNDANADQGFWLDAVVARRADRTCISGRPRVAKTGHEERRSRNERSRKGHRARNKTCCEEDGPRCEEGSKQSGREDRRGSEEGKR